MVGTGVVGAGVVGAGVVGAGVVGAMVLWFVSNLRPDHFAAKLGRMGVVMPWIKLVEPRGTSSFDSGIEFMFASSKDSLIIEGSALLIGPVPQLLLLFASRGITTLKSPVFLAMTLEMS